MTTLAPEMAALAVTMSAPFRIHNPMRFVAEQPDFLRGLATTVSEAATLMQENKSAEGFALEAWATFLLATGIGYDGYVVSRMGEKTAEFLRRSTTERSDDELLQLAEFFGIHKPEFYLDNCRREDIADDLWGVAYEQVKYHLRPYGLKLAFWAVCIRASEVDHSRTHLPAAVSEAARIYGAYASGS